MSAEEEIQVIRESKEFEVRQFAENLKQEFLVRQRELLGRPSYRLPDVWRKEELWLKAAACAMWAGADARTYIRVQSDNLYKPHKGMLANALVGEKCRNQARQYMQQVSPTKVQLVDEYLDAQRRSAEAASQTSAEENWEKFLEHLQSYHPLPSPLSRVILSQLDPLTIDRHKVKALNELESRPELEQKLEASGLRIRQILTQSSSRR